MADKPKLEVFYADPHNVVKWHGPVRTSWGEEVVPVKVDESELCLEDTPTIRATIPGKATASSRNDERPPKRAPVRPEDAG